MGIRSEETFPTSNIDVISAWAKIIRMDKTMGLVAYPGGSFDL